MDKTVVWDNVPEGIDLPPVEIPRRRHRIFASVYAREILSGTPDEEAKIKAAALAYPKAARKTPGKLRGLAVDALNEENVHRFIATAFDRYGFSFDAYVKKHIDHIQGLEYDVLNAKGEPVKVKDKPSYEALKDYRDMVVPKRPLKLDVTSRNVSLYVTKQVKAENEPLPVKPRKVKALPGE